MFFYQILLERNIPGSFLTYKSDLDLSIGQLVSVPVKSKSILGILVKKDSDLRGLDVDKVKFIEKTLPYIFNLKALSFLKIFSRNTFNSLNLVTESLLQPLKLLSKKNWQNLENNFILQKKSVNITDKDSITKDQQEISFLLEKDILMRIIYIIRSSLCTLKNNDSTKKQFNEILFIFPEKKYLEKIILEIKNQITKKELEDLEINKYFGDSSLESKKTLRNILDYSILDLIENKLRIIFCVKVGIFLPFSNLKQIILVDEANSMYIQDQNKIYYDTRDAAYILANSYNSNLTFLSSLPSIRLYNFYSDKVTQEFLTTDKLDEQNALNLQVSKRDNKMNHYDIFSYQIEEILNEES